MAFPSRRPPSRLFRTAFGAIRCALLLVVPALGVAQPVRWSPLTGDPGPPSLAPPEDGARPIGLATADLDEDGIPDLSMLYRIEETGGGYRVPGYRVATYRGRAESLVGSRASQRAPELPFESRPRVDVVPPATRIVAGDFDADGHSDVLLLAPGRHHLILLAGDGHGGLGEPMAQRLPGLAQRWVVGEVDRPDGLLDLVLSLDTPNGLQLAIFDSPSGVWSADPVLVPLTEPVAQMVLARLDGDAFIDLALATRRGVSVLAGIERSPSSAYAPRRVVAEWSVRAPVVSMAPAARPGTASPGLVVTLEGNELVEITPPPEVPADGRRVWSDPTQSTAIAPVTGFPVTGTPTGSTSRSRLALSAQVTPPFELRRIEVEAAHGVPEPPGRWVAVRAGARANDDLYLVPGTGAGLLRSRRPAHGDAAQWLPVLDESLGTIHDVLALRLNRDAFPDFAVLAGDRRAPIVIVSAGAAALVVNSTADSDDGACEPTGVGDCTFREALNAANLTPGLDTIEFSALASGDATIAVGEPPGNLGALPIVTDPVVIDGTTHPDGFVELDGSLAGTTANGLQVNFGSSTIRGLVINRFSPFSGLVLAFGSGNIVEGNRIGTDASGLLDLGNGGNGVLIIESRDNLVGGTTAAARNLISGNELPAIAISGSGATGNTVSGNYIGTDASGDVSLPTTSNNVLIHDGASGNTIGGLAAGAGNVVAGAVGASLPAVSIAGDTGTGGGLPVATTGNLVQGNLIGTDRTGALALGNASVGIFLSRNAPANTIGGAAAGAGNVIAASGLDGLRIDGALTNGTIVEGNRIGTDSSGGAPLPNGGHGVLLTGGASNTRIGATAPGAGNTIAFNAGNGVAVDSGGGNSVEGNSVFANGALGIDLCAVADLAGPGCLDPAAVTPNDPGDGDAGANALQNFPVLDLAITDGTVEGSLDSTPNTVFDLAFYANPSCEPSGHGEGETFLGGTQAVTDETGTVTFSVPLPAVLGAGSWIAATATDPAGSTSELSACRIACGAARDLVLELQTVSVATEFTACSNILAFNSFVVDADVTLRSGRTITLGNGFTATAGSTLRLVVDPLVQ